MFPTAIRRMSLDLAIVSMLLESWRIIRIITAVRVIPMIRNMMVLLCNMLILVIPPSFVP